MRIRCSVNILYTLYGTLTINELTAITPSRLAGETDN